MLESEMDEHLGYEKHNNLGDLTGNSRNGYNKKTIISDYGESEIVIPCDRNGEFEPKVLEKRQTRTDEIEQKILAMYAKGMSQRDIEDNLREIYGAEIPQTLISKITDKILPEVNDMVSLTCGSSIRIHLRFRMRKYLYTHYTLVQIRLQVFSKNISKKCYKTR
jgi:putative transposase